ncbi:hypothetical protein NC652_026339 [Populus alba x Populus x berolinensis]|nr:hypothetical protein NC652_026339 [Populus alba x Populus x berolinensis]
MGRLFVESLEGRIYSCKHCRTHIALYDDIVSKSFHCRHGKAYLFKKVYALGRAWASNGGGVEGEWRAKIMANLNDLNHLTLYGRVNVFAGEKEERMMITGLHTVADIFCVGCGSIVGWKYETAHEKSQKYKEGKSVLERFKVSGPDGSFYWVHYP